MLSNTLRLNFYLYQNYSHSSFALPSKNNKTYSKKYAKEQMCLYSWNYIINHNENEDENEKKIIYIYI